MFHPIHPLDVGTEEEVGRNALKGLGRQPGGGIEAEANGNPTHGSHNAATRGRRSVRLAAASTKSTESGAVVRSSV